MRHVPLGERATNFAVACFNATLCFNTASSFRDLGTSIFITDTRKRKSCQRVRAGALSGEVCRQCHVSCLSPFARRECLLGRHVFRLRRGWTKIDKKAIRESFNRSGMPPFHEFPPPAKREITKSRKANALYSCMYCSQQLSYVDDKNLSLSCGGCLFLPILDPVSAILPPPTSHTSSCALLSILCSFRLSPLQASDLGNKRG